MSLIHRETIDLVATTEQIRRFIMTPARILDYYPMGLDGGILEPEQAIWCQSQMGASLLEVLPKQSNDNVVVIKVTTAIGLAAPFTRERIESAAAFTMVEDWVLEPNESSTTLTKAWRDIKMIGEFNFPIADGLIKNAKQESAALVEGWNRAAREER